ncbi:hypothetical protein JCM10449v2_002156 [Rhodotorula kratochvilovae]
MPDHAPGFAPPRPRPPTPLSEAGPSTPTSTRGAASPSTSSPRGTKRFHTFDSDSEGDDTGDESCDLSEVETSGDSDADGSSYEEGDDDAIEDADAKPRKKVGRLIAEETGLWSRECQEALMRGLELVPDLKQHIFQVGGKRVGRNGLLAEYVRRQTGEERTASQVSNRLQYLRQRYKGQGQTRKSLVGAPADLGDMHKRDWDAYLGTDHFPKLAQKRRSTRKQDKQPKRKLKRKKRAAPESLAASPALRDASQQQGANHPKYSSSLPLASASRVPPVFSASSFAATVSSSLPEPDAPAKPSLDVKPRLPDHSFANDIRAFLTSLSPSHDFTAASRFLVSGGISSSSALADLLFLEPSMLDAFLETAQARQKVKLPALEMAWLKRVLALAREEMGAEG